MPTQEESVYHFGFSSFVGIGPVRFDRLIAYFGSSKTAYCAPENQLKTVIGTALAKTFTAYKNNFDLKKEYEAVLKQQIKIIARCDNRYPPTLFELHDPPICLYVKGDIDGFDFQNKRFLAIVGTRKPTEYGITIARTFGRDISQAGVCIVSGMALGIDAQAHWGALDAHSKTIAVLGCGVNIIYPPSNKQLYDEILKHKGIILSEFPPDRTVARGLFVSRNRLIAALSKGVFVVEGLKDSGSLVTARCALDIGREVFAPPGPITSVLSQAPNSLLQEGATMVTCVQDILDEFNLQSNFTQHEEIRKRLNSLELQIYDVLSQEPVTADEISRRLTAPVSQILPILSGMEIAGYIKKNNQSNFQLVG